MVESASGSDLEGVASRHGLPHAQFFHQFALAANAVEIADREDAQ